ncbi:hypothetical protein AQZ52_09670 [Novosphingobium fuchskuhlense]|uniref:Uncharacterized protein n=1 Tax=Novosphingobium fuchskuhlense TaxID=1117702 RepID=A0A124JV27_9SPHN|nr:hypothetical protein [Novosphingobium fuchskuhlense]KUR71840.1 hypothetical protein AQZ52_09670 [Novosphingobium fuchskuhlense]
MTDSETPPPESPEAPTDPLGKVKGFVEEHPVAMVAGGILLGALVAGAMSRSSKSVSGGVTGDRATRKGTLARLSLPRRAADLAAMGLELAAAYAAGAAGEKAATPAGEAEAEAETEAKAEAPAKTDTSRLPALAGKALRTLAPVITRHLPGKKAD